MNQKRIGIIITYVNLFLGMVINLIITPLMINSLGDVDYSIYKLMQSFSGPLAMFHLGISTIVTRSIIKYQALDDYTEQEKQNTLAHSLLVSVIMSVFVIIAGIIMCLLIPSVYGKTYDKSSVSLGQTIFVLFMLSTVFYMLSDAFFGCLIGHEKFAVNSSIKVFQHIFKFVMILTLLKCGFGVVGVVCVDLAIAVLTFAFTAIYATGKLREIPKWFYFNKSQIKEILFFGSAIFLQTIVNQVNSNVDTIILGAIVVDKSIITMYSSALTIFAFYSSIVSAVSNFFLPKATRLIINKASGSQLTDYVIAPGRVQAIIAVGCLCGFALFGMNFINIWIGEKYINAYWITIMLMIPATISLVQSVALSILDASLKTMYRSTVLFVMSLINVVISVVLVSFLGFWGAAIGTVISLMLGNVIMMNVYYAKTFKMEIGRMFASIFKGILPAGVLASLICIPLSLFLMNTVYWFVLKCCCFIILYAVFLWLFGINKYEKETVKNLFGKVLHKKH